MSEAFEIKLPNITFEQLCDWNGGIAGGKCWNVPRKNIRKNFPGVFQHWADAPPSGLIFEVAANYFGETKYFWVQFV